MRQKSETFEIFKEYKAEVENFHGKNIKSLRSDHGGEYLLGEFRQYLEDHGITSHMSAIGMPQQCSRKEEYDSLRYGEVDDELCESP